MPTWLITGGSGFLGRHVLKAAAGLDGVDVRTLGRRPPAGADPRGFLAADLEQPETVARAVRLARPDVVVHAAGRTPPGSPDEFERANTRGTLHLLDALRATARSVRVVLLGSAAELGPVPEDKLPVGETYSCRPADAYAQSKCLATLAALITPRPLEVMVARVFNPIGPGLSARQAFGRFAARLLDPTPGPMLVGDLDVRRDFVDVRDVARAVIALAARGKGGRVYHVGTGASHGVGEGLRRLVDRSGRSIEVRVDPGRCTWAGPRDSRADVRRILDETGWRAEVSFAASLDDLWDEARGRTTWFELTNVQTERR